MIRYILQYNSIYGMYMFWLYMNILREAIVCNRIQYIKSQNIIVSSKQQIIA